MPGLYGSRWQKYRAGYLRLHPVCNFCEQVGRVSAATVVDHIIPHKGDLNLFWDTKNHQALCKPCHDRHKQRIEKGGKLQGCDSSGFPLDRDHHWLGEGGSKV